MQEINLDFKQWIKETATSTSCIAVFARPIMTNFEPNQKKKKKKKD